MSVRYCLGLEHRGAAESIDPNTHGIHDLRKKLHELVPRLSFNELVGIPSLAWSNERLTTHVLAQLSFGSHEFADRFVDEFVGGLSGGGVNRRVLRVSRIPPIYAQ
jgi:hypothetical protein